MSENDEFAEAVEAGSGSGDTWKPDEQKIIIGTLKAKKSNVGPNSSMVYVVKEDAKDEPTNVWGSTVLDSRFEEVPLGARVKVEFLGLEEGKRGKYKAFKVQYIPSKDVQNVQDVIPGAEAA